MTDHDTNEGERPAPLAGTSAVAEYSPTAAALADLTTRFKDLVWDVSVPSQMADAKAARRELREYRVGLEKKRVELKAPILEHAGLLDSEARRIRLALEALEDPIDEQIKKQEAVIEERRAARAAEEAERLRVEAERIAAIRVQIRDLQQLPVEAVGKSAVQIQELIVRAGAFDVASIDPEYRLEAEASVDEAIRKLTAMRIERVASDDMKRALQEQRDAQAAEARARDEAVAKELADRVAEVHAKLRSIRDDAVAGGAAWYPVLPGEADPTPKPVASPTPAPAPDTTPTKADPVSPPEPSAERAVPPSDAPATPPPDNAAPAPFPFVDRPDNPAGFRVVGQIVGEVKVGFQFMPLIAWTGDVPIDGTWLLASELSA